MATVTVIKYKITASYGTYGGVAYDVDTFIHVRLNDATEVVDVMIKDTSADDGGTVIGYPTAGPSIFGGTGSVLLLTPLPFYQYCSGTTLKKIQSLNTWPYGNLVSYTNAAECQIAPTCDLDFSSSYTVTPTSGPSTNDGSFTVSATSSNGTIKFSLDPNFDYTTQGQVSGTFSNLYEGEYTVCATDALGCTDSIVIKVEVTTAYGVRWRLEYDDLAGFTSRVDIVERAYAGSVTEVNGSDEPVRLLYDGNNDEIYEVTKPSELIIGLLSETEGQFQDLFTQDDRKYLVKFYKDFGSGFNLFWIGYIIPEFYCEPDLSPPFYTEVTAACG